MHRKLLLSLLISFINLIHGQLRVTTNFKDVTIDHEKSRSFSCSAAGGTPPYSFAWFQDSNQVDNIPNKVSLNAKGDTMTIFRMDKNLAGQYRCVVTDASNQQQRSDTFEIQYRGKSPGAVTKAKATPVSGSESTEVLLLWSLPNDLGFNRAEDLIYNIKLCVLPGLTLCETQQTKSLSIRMSVRPQTRYSVIITTSTVTGLNGQAESLVYNTPLCSTSQYKCPEEDKCIRNTTRSSQICNGVFDCRDKSDENELCVKPSSVELLEPEVGTQYSIIIRWKKPKASERITGYQITLNTGFSDTFKANGNTVKRVITSLKQNTKYTVRIRARNPSGYSSAVSEDVFETDKGPVGYAVDVENYSKKRVQFFKWKPPTQTGGVPLNELLYTVQWQKKGSKLKPFAQNITGGRLEYDIPMDNYKDKDNFYYWFTVSNGARVGGSKTVNDTFVFKPREPFEFLSVEVFRTFIVLAWPSHIPPDVVYGYTLKVGSRTLKLKADVTDYNVTGLEKDTEYKIQLTRKNGDREDQYTSTTELTKNCAPREFQCKNGECLPNFGQVCNSNRDCSDGSDEEHLYKPANCKLPGQVDFNITAQYKGLEIHLLNLNGSINAVVIVDINGAAGDVIKLPNGQTVRGIKRDSLFGALVIQDPNFSPSIASTVYVYGVSQSGEGPILSKQARTLGPIALPPELIEQGAQFLDIEFQGLPGINELSLESYTIEYKHTNDHNKLNETLKIETSKRPLEYKFDDLEYNTSYSFRYKVEDSDGESDYSPWVKFSTAERELPGEPKNLELRPRRSEIDAIWDKTDGQSVVGYRVQYKKSDTSSWEDAKETKVDTNKYTIQGLDSGDDYDVRVAARNDKGSGEFVEAGTTTDDNICPGYDWKKYGSSCYYRGQAGLDGKTFDEARDDCKTLGGDLASITSASEGSDILYEVRREPVVNVAYFNGLQRTSETAYKWTDGTSFGYSQIDKDEEFDKRQQCVVMVAKDGGQFTWVSARCNSEEGFVCKRENVNDKPLELVLKSNGFDSLTFQLPTTTLNRQSKYFVEIIDSEGGRRTLTVSSDDGEFTVEKLVEDDDYDITVQEDFNGLGPKTKQETFTTARFISPSAVKESKDEKVRYAESQKREIVWKYGDLGDSKKENVNVRVRFCYIAKCDFKDFNGTTGVLDELRADTKYNYTVQVFDRVYLKSGKISEAKEFRTDEKDTCRDDEWLCAGGSKCIKQKSRCDNKFDCPSDIPGRSVDEQKVAGCSPPEEVEISKVIGGLDFLKIHWKVPEEEQRVRGYTLLVNNKTRYSVSGNKTSYRVSNLKEGSLVTYTISAFNPTGDGEKVIGNKRLANESAPTSAVRNLKADEKNQAKISWQTPSKLNNNDPETMRYDIKLCYTDQKDKSKTCDEKSVTNKLHYIIQSLKPSKNYTVVVVATNEYDQSGAPSNEIRFVTTLCKSDEFECKFDGTCISKNDTCDGKKDCKDAADEKKNAGCALAPNVVIEKESLGASSVSIKYHKLKRLANQIVFTLTTKEGSFLQEEIVKGDDVLKDGVVTFTKGVKAESEYKVKAVVYNFIGKNKGTVLDIETPKENAPPGKPQDVKFETTENEESSSVKVSWKTPYITGGKPKDQLKYKIRICIDGTEDCDDLITEAGSTERVVDGLKPDTQYRFKISAYSSNKTKGDEEKASYKTLDKDTCKADSYYRCPIKCLNPNRVCDGVIDCIDQSDESKEAKCSAPEKIDDVDVVASWNSLTFKWEEPKNNPIEYYLSIQCSINKKDSPIIKVTLPKTKTSYTFEGLTENEDKATCEFGIIPSNLIGDATEFKGVYTTKTLGTPSIPKKSKVTKVDGFETKQVKLEWEPPSNLGNARPKEIKYKLEWCNTKDDCKDKTVAGRSAILEDLTPGTEYDVEVTAINPLGKFGEPLKLVFSTASKDTLPSAPQNVKVTKHPDHPNQKAIVKWQPPKDKTGLKNHQIGYKIEYCIKPVKDCRVIEIDVGAQNYTIVDMEGGQLYGIRVAALGRGGTFGDYSDKYFHTTGGESVSSGLASWEIALIVVAILLIIVIVLAIVIRAYYKSRSSKTYESTDGSDKSKMNGGYQADEKV